MRLKILKDGIYLLPIIEGKAISEEEFEKLDDRQKEEFEKKSVVVQEEVLQVMNKIKTIEQEATSRIDEWQANISLLTINLHTDSIKAKYKKYPKIQTFVNSIKKDILRSIPEFVGVEEKDDTKKNLGESMK